MVKAMLLSERGLVLTQQLLSNSSSCGIEPPSQSAATKPTRHSFPFFFFFFFSTATNLTVDQLSASFHHFDCVKMRELRPGGGHEHGSCRPCSAGLLLFENVHIIRSSITFSSFQSKCKINILSTCVSGKNKNKKFQFAQQCWRSCPPCEAGWTGSGGRLDVKQQGLVVSTWPVGRATVLLSKYGRVLFSELYLQSALLD